MNDMENSLPSKDVIDNNVRTLDQQVTLTSLNLLMVITGVFKLMFFIRVYEGIGWIVELVA